MENQNTKDIRYVDEKLDHFKSEINSAMLNQGRATAELTGEVKVLEEQLHSTTERLETKIDRVQENLNRNINELTVAITRLTAMQEVTSKTLEGINSTLKQMGSVNEKLGEHEGRISSIEVRNKKADAISLELQKEDKKGKWGFITAIATGIFSIAAVLISLFYN
jgi:chromosome segregation ATPase